MAIDHLLDEDGGLADPPTFAISAILSLVVAAAVFGLVVPRATTETARAATRGLILSLLAVLLLPPVGWLGPPVVLAGGGIALGLRGLEGERAGRAKAAVAVGALVVAIFLVFYATQAVDKLV